MAKENSIKGKHVDNSTGSWVTCQRYGKLYNRRKPFIFKDARTASQLLQRGRMDGVVAFYNTLKPTEFHRIWKIAAEGGGCSGYNLFVGANINAFNKEMIICNYHGITLSMGRLPLPIEVKAVMEDSGNTVITWTEVDGLTTARDSDRLMVAVMYEHNPFEVILCDTDGVLREEGRAELQLDKREGSKAHLYVFFASANSEQYSGQWYFELK